MSHITQFIPVRPVAGFFEVVLEDYQVEVTLFYNLTADRWTMNISNLTLGANSYGIIMNQGIDLLNSSPQLDLQALVLVNATKVDGLEADESNLGADLVLIYMDLDNYAEFVLGNAALKRPIYRVGGL